MYIIGIDIGTTKIAGVLLRISDNTSVKIISEENKASLPSSEPWEKIQEPAKILEIALYVINKLKHSIDRPVCSIGISSQMHGFLYINEMGDACSPLFTWQDSRATVPLEANTTAQSLIKEKTGHSIFSGYALATHYFNWLKGLQPLGLYKIVSIGSYLAMKLCNVSEAYIDPSEAAGFGLYDLERQSFFFDSITKLWGTVDFLPQLVPFYHQVGTDENNIPVFQSLGDNQASFYGAMRGHADAKLLINLGTGGQISFQTDKLTELDIIRLRGMEVRPYFQGKLVVGATLAGGKSFELLVNFFAEVLSFFGIDFCKQEIYKRIEVQVDIENLEHCSGDKPLFVEPYFYGTREDPEKRGAIRNIGSDNLKAEQLVYSFATAIVSELKELWTLNGFGEKSILKKVVGSGNGVRRNPIVCHMIEKIFQSELIISEIEEEAACGAAWYASHAMGPDQMSIP